jgi:hypothetical protein
MDKIHKPSDSEPAYIQNLNCNYQILIQINLDIKTGSDIFMLLLQLYIFYLFLS